MPCDRTVLMLALLLPAVLSAGGCIPGRNAAVLEARLRRQAARLAAAQSELEAARSELKTARRSRDALRARLAAGGQPVMLPEQDDAFHSLAGIELSRLLTGSLDRDGVPGDELLSTVVVPHDEQGSLVKVPGRIEIELFDLARPEGSNRIGRWEFDEDESRRHWHQGLFSSGYLFHLPWQENPQSSTLMLRAELTTSDGRRFDASRQIEVDPQVLVVRSEATEPADRSGRMKGEGGSLRPLSAASHRAPKPMPKWWDTGRPRPVPATADANDDRGDTLAGRDAEPDANHDDGSPDVLTGPRIAPPALRRIPPTPE